MWCVQLHVFAVVGELDAGGVAGLKTFNETFDNYSQVLLTSDSSMHGVMRSLFAVDY